MIRLHDASGVFYVAPASLLEVRGSAVRLQDAAGWRYVRETPEQILEMRRLSPRCSAEDAYAIAVQDDEIVFLEAVYG